VGDGAAERSRCSAPGRLIHCGSLIARANSSIRARSTTNQSVVPRSAPTASRTSTESGTRASIESSYRSGLSPAPPSTTNV
jgi:hypothetical protein